MTGYRSSLAATSALSRDPDPAQALAAARHAYRDTDGEIVLISKKWLKGWGDKDLLDALAAKARVKVGKR